MKRVLLIALLFSLPAYLGAQGCTNADLSGSYAAIGEGTVVMPPPGIDIHGPLVRIGHVVARNGQITFTSTYGSYNGVIYDHTFGGTYRVNPDCTVDMLFFPAPEPLSPPPPAPPNALPFTGTIADHGTNVRLTSVTPGTVATASLFKVAPDECSVAAIRGKYQLDMSGFVVPPVPPPDAPPPSPFARVGELVFNGDGSFEGAALANYAGILERESFSGGTYTIASPCGLPVEANLIEALQRRTVCAAAPSCELTLQATITEAPDPSMTFFFPDPPFGPFGPSYNQTMKVVMTDHAHGVLIQTVPDGVAFNGKLVQAVPGGGR